MLDGFDEFWNGTFQHVTDTHSGPDSLSTLSPAMRAWQKAMIPLTRPIDTLVITVQDMNSSAANLLFAVANDFPDFIDVIEEP